MLKYFSELSTRKKINIIAGAIIGVIFFFSLVWGVSIGCVALGYGPKVCGL